MMLPAIHPGLLMIGAGIAVLLLPGGLRKGISLLASLLALLAILTLHTSSTLTYTLAASIRLELIEVDRLSLAFLWVFCIAGLINAVYALDIQDKYEKGLAMIYTGSILSVTLAGDTLSFVFFWEVAAFSAAYLVYAGHCRRSSRSAFRYLLMHAFGGNMLLVGVLLHAQTGGLALPHFTGADGSAAFWCILIGVAVNAVMPPFGSWIVDAYPEATLGGTVYMCGYTTKIGIYALIRMFAGTEALLAVGVFMAIYGVCMALIENDLRRLFSYHIVSQLGYMIAALAVGGSWGVDGATAHAFNHILYKCTLMMCSGAVIYATGRRKIDELGGLRRRMPVTAYSFLIASLAIAGMPFLNGFASKAIVMHAVEVGGHELAYLLLTAASVGTWLSVVLKVNAYVFFGKEPAKTYEAIKPVPRSMSLAMLAGAGACVVTGVYPQLVYRLLPYRSDPNPFTPTHILEYLFLFAGATLVFWLCRRRMRPHDGLTLDFDYALRRPLPWLIRQGTRGLNRFTYWADGVAVRLAGYLGVHFADPYQWTKASRCARIRRLSLENEDRAIGSVVEQGVAVLGILFLIISIAR